MRQNQPLIVQNDSTILIETAHPSFKQVREYLRRFAELIKSPQHLHTYRITPMSLWNAAASGWTAEQIISILRKSSKFDIPRSIRNDIEQFMHRYGLLRLEHADERIHLKSQEEGIIEQLDAAKSLKSLQLQRIDKYTLSADPADRGLIKQHCIHLGFPVEDLAGYHQGETINMELRSKLPGGRSFQLRDYQKQAVSAFYQDGAVHGGSGVLVLPCGSGKTIIGLAAMAEVGCATLILTTNVTSVRQWKQELMAKTSLTSDMIGEYSGSMKEVKPITIATYQILTYRKSKTSDFLHMNLFNERDWGLIIYDEVHLLPAPVFRVTASIQATRRLGLTATLVREDGHEEDVFSLVGPKRYEAQWKELEQQGWIAHVHCTEIRVPLSQSNREQYVRTEPRQRNRIAAENPLKIKVVKQLLKQHSKLPTLIIGQYLNQLEQLSKQLHAPLISGRMPHSERERLFEQFKKGHLPLLIVSKVANFAVDLPDAALAIQVSGSFGSRQEEAQRLGRILRPKSHANEAFFYTVVTGDSREQDFSMNRQLFLIEQGYRYDVRDAEMNIQE